jgi:hypothetical protein
MAAQPPSLSPVKLGLAVWWPAFWTGFPFKLVIGLLFLSMGVHPWEMPGLAFLLLLSLPIDLWAMGVASRTVFLERLRLNPPENLGMTLWWQVTLLNAVYLPLAYVVESQVTHGAQAAAEALTGLPFLKSLPVAERIGVTLTMWGSVALVMLIILVLIYLTVFGRLVRNQARSASPSTEPYHRLVRTWDLTRVPADQPLVLTLFTGTGIFLVLCFWFFLPVTTPHPHESYKEATVKKTPAFKPVEAIKKSEQALIQAENGLAALETKLQEAKEQEQAGKTKGKAKGKEPVKEPVKEPDKSKTPTAAGKEKSESPPKGTPPIAQPAAEKAGGRLNVAAGHKEHHP